MLIKQHSIVGRILLMIAITGLFLGAVIITAGAVMIYNSTENGIKTEICTAARTFGNIYNSHFEGDLSYDGEVCLVGDTEISSDDFNTLTGVVSCEEDVDFTLFYNDIRVFTSVKNVDGSLAVGTKAADEVTEMVIKGGSEYLYPRVLVNDRYYMGYYIPISSQSGEVQGMIFAGKPIESAEATAVDAVVRFIVLAAVTLIIALAFCFFSTRSVIADITDIKHFLAKLADGDFSVRLSDKTIKRSDEIGELSSHAVKVRNNLRDMVERDPLTMLFNRRGCRNKIDRLIEERVTYSVIMGDIDFFKKINDTYGHAAGDYVLKNVSAILNNYSVQNGGFASRWGGEEFLMIIPKYDTEGAKDIADRLLQEIRETDFCFDGEDIDVTMTFGISTAKNGENSEVVINRADELLYKGKTSGRNQVVV